MSDLITKLAVLWHRFLCVTGFHTYDKAPIIASLDHYWMQAGAECAWCRKKKIDFNQASIAANAAYVRGKQNSETHHLAYGRGIKKIVKLYGKKYVEDILKDLS